MKKEKEDETILCARVPVELAEQFARVAEMEDRTVSGELRRLIKRRVAEAKDARSA